MRKDCIFSTVPCFQGFFLSFSGKNSTKLKTQIYMDLRYIDPQAKLLNYCFKFWKQSSINNCCDKRGKGAERMRNKCAMYTQNTSTCRYAHHDSDILSHILMNWHARRHHNGHARTRTHAHLADAVEGQHVFCKLNRLCLLVRLDCTLCCISLLHPVAFTIVLLC